MALSSPFQPEPDFTHGQAARIAVLLCNLGTPDAPTAPAVRRYLARLKPAQEALGDCNDLGVAEAVCRAAPRRSEGDAFVLGWLSARRDALSAIAAAQLQALGEAPRFWKA